MEYKNTEKIFQNMLSESNNIRVFEYYKNSCYMDSILFALLLQTPDQFYKILTKKFRTNIQGCTIDVREKVRDELIKLLLKVNGFDSSNVSLRCSNLREHLKECGPKQFEYFGDYQTKDADEFLKFLFYILEENNQIMRIKTYSEEGDAVADYPSSPVFDINFSLLQNKEQITIVQLLNYVDKINNKYQQVYPLKFDPLIINVQRSSPKGFIRTKVIPEKAIRVGRKVLRLSAIVVWRSDHYTVFKKISTSGASGTSGTSYWVYFDDTKERLTIVGDYSTLIKKSIVLTNGTLYFYF